MDTLLSPAKLNLGLTVLEPRDDGYHDIESLFVKITLYDRLFLSISDSNTFSINITGFADFPLLYSRENIIHFALNYFHSKGKLSSNIKANIFLEKHIPVGGGLGGGSSNAGVLLKYLYKKGFLKDVSEEDLVEIGADVPFFFYDYILAAVKDRGEKVVKGLKTASKIPEWLKDGVFVIVYPGISIGTAQAYSMLKKKEIYDKALKGWSLNVISSMTPTAFKGLINTFERVIFEYYPELLELKKAFLSSGALFSLMSGSGSCVYGFFTNLENAMYFIENDYYPNIHDEKFRIYLAKVHLCD